MAACARLRSAACIFKPSSKLAACKSKVYLKVNTISVCLPHARHITSCYGVTLSRDVQGESNVLLASTNIDIDDYRERFIPITRRSVIRHLMQEENFLNEGELKIFEDFALALDSSVVQRYHGVLQEIKMLFDPINPDKDTIATKVLNRRERLDSEFWTLQKLEDVMEKANFHELPKHVVQTSLSEHCASEGVLVEVNPDKYDVLRYWALGKEKPERKQPWYSRAFYRVTKRAGPAPIEYYKRVVVAVRLKRDQKLILKAFKEVPINALEMLLPDGKIKMKQLDKGILATSLSIAVIGLLAKVVTYLAHYNINWTLILTGVTGVLGVRAWTVYKNKKNAYLVDLTRMLYFKNIANNRGLLTLLVDRAEDESFKEALLTYTMLLTNRSPSVRSMDSSDHMPKELGGISQTRLEQKIEDWVLNKTGSRIEFDANEAVSLLQSLGLAQTKDGHLYVLPIEGTLRNLPIIHQTLSARTDEADIVEGYDRDYFQETEEEYKEEEKRSKKFGWF